MSLDLKASLKSNDSVIIGDFNLPGIDWFDVRATRDSANNSLLIDIIQNNFLTQLVNETTRECNILDLVLTTSPEFVCELAIGELFSHHHCLTFYLSGSLPRPCKSKKLVYAYRKADW